MRQGQANGPSRAFGLRDGYEGHLSETYRTVSSGDQCVRLPKFPIPVVRATENPDSLTIVRTKGNTAARTEGVNLAELCSKFARLGVSRARSALDDDRRYREEGRELRVVQPRSAGRGRFDSVPDDRRRQSVRVRGAELDSAGIDANPVQQVSTKSPRAWSTSCRGILLDSPTSDAGAGVAEQGAKAPLEGRCGRGAMGFLNSSVARGAKNSS